MSSMPTPSPYSSTTQTTEPSALTKQLLGLSPNAPYYSPYQSLARQGAYTAKLMEGVTTKPTWSSLYEFYGVPHGTDLTPYLQATQTGGVLPARPIPASPPAENVPEFTAPAQSETSSKKGKADGGLMSLRKYAKGGLTTAQATAVRNISNAIQKGNATQAQIDKLNKIESSTGINVSPYVSTGTGAIPSNRPNVATAVANATKAYQDTTGAPKAVTEAQALTSQVPGMDLTKFSTDTQYGGLTNPIAQQAIDQLRAASVAPETIGQGAGIMGQNAAALAGMANYTPQQVAAQQAAAQGYQATGMQAPQDIQAQRYAAATMQGGPNINAVGVGTNQMFAPQDVQAARTQGALISGPQSWTTPGISEQYMDPYVQNVISKQLQIQNQQNAIQNAALRSQAAQQKAFGGSRGQLAVGQQQFNQALANQNLVQQGLSGAYQSGLGQFNTAQQQRLAAQQANQASLNQASLANQAARMQAQQLNQAAGLTTGQANLSAAQQSALANQSAAMQAQQLNQLYGLGGYQAQAANQAAQNQAMQNYVNNALQAAQISYGGQLTAAQQNQVAQNAASQFAAQAQNTAALQNAQLATQAAIQNQQAGISANQMNLSALSNAGQLGQGLGSLGVSTWGAQQNIPQLWGAAAQNVQGLGQQSATAAQQTAQNILGATAAGWAPTTNLVSGAAGQVTTANKSTIPGLTG